MKKCNPGYYAGTSTPIYIPLDNGKQMGWTSDGIPCSFKPTTSSLNWSEGFSSVGTRYQPSQNHSISYSSFDKQFLERRPTTYTRPEFVPYTQPSQPFVEPDRPYAPPEKIDPVIVNKKHIDKSVDF